MLTNNASMARHYAQEVKQKTDFERMETVKDLADTHATLEHVVEARFGNWGGVMALPEPEDLWPQGQLLVAFTRSLAGLANGRSLSTLVQGVREKTNTTEATISLRRKGPAVASPRCRSWKPSRPRRNHMDIYSG